MSDLKHFFFLQNCNFYKNSRIRVVFDYNSLFRIYNQKNFIIVVDFIYFVLFE